ncbi:hypothetical protein NP493_1488g00029 [Ridgeia piscesae]|uniref:Uncharacterized protein n=1 Tax=Ridgeia piscesae TaxID=27915 RepID=A0AAD9K1G1_RIDPI|nr:hypothetical protein NP493_1488g00029 [Ridgeia piscesae]
MGNAKYRRPEMPVVDYSSKWQECTLALHCLWPASTFEASMY